MDSVNPQQIKSTLQESRDCPWDMDTSSRNENYLWNICMTVKSQLI